MKSFFLILWKWIKRLVLAFFALSILSVIVYRWVPVPVTPLMLIRCVEQKFAGEPMKLDKKWVSFEEISPNLPLAVFCSEDQDFFRHHGFNFKAIQEALKHDEHSKRIVGASTVSQQTAKNVFLSVNRSWVRKGFEAYFTVLIEFFWSKKRIMEVYLNVVEFGKGIYGAEAASEAYFHKHAKDLNKEEAASLAAVLPDPLKWSAAHPGPYVQSRIDWILGQMADYGGKLDFSNPPAAVK